MSEYTMQSTVILSLLISEIWACLCITIKSCPKAAYLYQHIVSWKYHRLIFWNFTCGNGYKNDKNECKDITENEDLEHEQYSYGSGWLIFPYRSWPSKEERGRVSLVTTLDGHVFYFSALELIKYEEGVFPLRNCCNAVGHLLKPLRLYANHFLDFIHGEILKWCKSPLELDHGIIVPIADFIFGFNHAHVHTMFLSIQWSAVITRSNVVRYYMNNQKNWGRISIRCWIHKIHPIPRPNGRAMGCILLIFVRKLTAL